MKSFVDVHCHLNDEMFENNADEIINSFSKNDVKSAIIAGYDLPSCKKAINFANSYENVYATIGLHPNDSDGWNEEFEQFLIDNLNNEKVVAVGEIGLDYHYENTNKEKQKQVFVKQLEIAKNFKLPVVIHVRDAIGDLIEVLKLNKHLLTYGGIIHCFSESVESYKILKNLGFKFSFGGVVTFKNAVKVQELIKNVDVSDIMFETDSPYLTPEPLRGKEINQPKNICYVIRKIAGLKNIDENVLIDVSNENVKKVFKKIKWK